MINAILVVDVAITAFSGITGGAGDGQVGNHIIGFGYFKPYTMDSNVLMFFASAIMIAFCIKNLVHGADMTPKWALTFYLTGSSCLFLTMFIAAVFLGPMKVMMGESYFVMFQDDMFFFHLLNPLIAIFTFTFLMKKHRYGMRDCLPAIVPTVIYSVVYLIMVVFLKKWNDFYGFTFGGRYYLVPLVIIVVYCLVSGFAALLSRLHNRHIPGNSPASK